MMSDCIIWTGARDSSGYGSIRDGKKVLSVHRFAYQLMYGEIPKGLVIDHECHNEALAKGECEGGKQCQHRACYNIEHLQVTTYNNNQLYGSHGWGNKTTCKKGHELTEDNIKVTKNQRYCIACFNEAKARKEAA